MKIPQQQKRWIWQAVLVIGLLVELVLVAGSVDAMLTEGDREIPAWQQIAFIGILVWIYIAYLKQRALDLSIHMVDVKIKTHALVEQLAEGVILLGSDNRVLILNRPATDISGLQEVDSLGLDLVSEIGEPAAGLLRSGAEGEADGQFTRNRHIARISVKRLGRATEGDANKLVVIRDAAATRKQAPTGDGSDHIAALLLSATNHLGLRLQQATPPETRAACARAILRAQAARLLVECRNVQPPGSKASIDLKPLLARTLESFAAPASALGIQLDQAGVGEARMTADEKLLPLVLRQVLLNALLGTEDAGGVITIKTGPFGQNIGLAVFDPGPAIEKTKLDRLFAPDFTGATTPSGNPCRTDSPGLLAARKIVEAHGGSLWAECPGGETGLRVAFMLPGA